MQELNLKASRPISNFKKSLEMFLLNFHIFLGEKKVPVKLQAIIEGSKQ